MANDIQNQRRIAKALSGNQTISEPTSNDHTDGTWIPTDVYEYEFAISGNTLENANIQFRIGSLLVKVLSKEGVQALISQGGGGIPEPIADGTFARKKTGSTFEWVKMANDIVNFSDTHISRLIALVFEQLTRSGSASPSSFEKGVATQIDYNYNINENDDVITQIAWDGSIDNTPPFDLTGTAEDPAAEDTVQRILEIDTEDTSISNLTLKSTAIIPQWRGVSTETDFSGAYVDLNAELAKVVQSSDNQTAVFAMANEYAYFVSINANATIKDGNGFSQSIGAWGDGVSGFYKKSINVELANNAIEVLTIYRTRETKNATVTYSLT